MLYPIMPLYLKQIGFSVFFIGLLEGLAEAVAGISKGYFGKMSDATARRVPFVQLGYALSSISKPLMAVFIYPLWVFFARTLDRVGKGVRTGARDALLSDETTPENKGRIFGFHRSMDTLGAVAGPSIALLFLYIYPGRYRLLFLLAFIPGLLSILTTLLLKEKKQTLKKAGKISFWSFILYWKQSSPTYRKLIAGLLLFALFNSSDVFLLLRAKACGYSDTTLIGVYIFYNLVFALFAYPLGVLADKIGLKQMFITGLFIFAIVYFGMAARPGQYGLMALFFLYGIYAAATEGISKAWITNVTPEKEKATAIGAYAAFQSLAALLASAGTGLVWYLWGGGTAFVLSAGMALSVAFYFLAQRGMK